MLACLLVAVVYGLIVFRSHRANDAARREEESRQRALEAEAAERELEEQRRLKELEDRPKPPLFEKWHWAELALPQHHVVDPFANGKKYLWVRDHVHGEPFQCLFFELASVPSAQSRKCTKFFFFGN